LKFAFRTLSRSPLFTGIAVLSLALGVGANTAIFTILDQLMLRLLPVKDPANLVMLYQEAPNNGNNVSECACTRIRCTRTSSSERLRLPRCSAADS
jgi:hypothetical protein